MADAREIKISISKSYLEGFVNKTTEMIVTSVLAGGVAVAGVVGVYNYTESVPIAVITGSFVLFIYLINVVSWTMIGLLESGVNENLDDINGRLKKIETSIAEGDRTNEKDD